MIEMTDDLRTRIAAAIESVRIQRDGDAAFMADAVIRELNLREERRYPNRLPHYTFMPPQRTRYVTEWKS